MQSFAKATKQFFHDQAKHLSTHLKTKKEHVTHLVDGDSLAQKKLGSVDTFIFNKLTVRPNTSPAKKNMKIIYYKEKDLAKKRSDAMKEILYRLGDQPLDLIRNRLDISSIRQQITLLHRTQRQSDKTQSDAKKEALYNLVRQQLRDFVKNNFWGTDVFNEHVLETEVVGLERKMESEKKNLERYLQALTDSYNTVEKGITRYLAELALWKWIEHTFPNSTHDEIIKAVLADSFNPYTLAFLATHSDARMTIERYLIQRDQWEHKNPNKPFEWRYICPNTEFFSQAFKNQNKPKAIVANEQPTAVTPRRRGSKSVNGEQKTLASASPSPRAAARLSPITEEKSRLSPTAPVPPRTPSKNYLSPPASPKKTELETDVSEGKSDESAVRTNYSLNLPLPSGAVSPVPKLKLTVDPNVSLETSASSPKAVVSYSSPHVLVSPEVEVSGLSSPRESVETKEVATPLLTSRTAADSARRPSTPGFGLDPTSPRSPQATADPKETVYLDFPEFSQIYTHNPLRWLEAIISALNEAYFYGVNKIVGDSQSLGARVLKVNILGLVFIIADLGTQLSVDLVSFTCKNVRDAAIWIKDSIREKLKSKNTVERMIPVEVEPLQRAASPAPEVKALSPRQKEESQQRQASAALPTIHAKLASLPAPQQGVVKAKTLPTRSSAISGQSDLYVQAKHKRTRSGAVQVQFLRKSSMEATLPQDQTASHVELPGCVNLRTI